MMNQDPAACNRALWADGLSIPRDLLTDFELMILLAILRVGEAPYGVLIGREISARRPPQQGHASNAGCHTTCTGRSPLPPGRDQRLSGARVTLTGR